MGVYPEIALVFLKVVLDVGNNSSHKHCRFHLKNPSIQNIFNMLLYYNKSDFSLFSPDSYVFCGTMVSERFCVPTTAFMITSGLGDIGHRMKP